MKIKFIAISSFLLGLSAVASANMTPTRIIEVKANNREDRSRLANLGYALEDFRSDRVFIWGQEKDLNKIKSAGFTAQSYEMPERLLRQRDNEESDAHYHSYDQAIAAMQAMEQAHSNIVTISSMGKSVEGRDMPVMRISGKSLAQAEASKLPVVFYMGCHHAREHLSVEVPLMFAQYLLDNYGKNPDVTRLVDSREIYVAPIINPDGFTYDFQGDNDGKMWRKNRSNNGDGTYGVDLNRNYGYQWNTGGSSTDTDSEVYMGPAPFSEPETQFVKAFVDAQPRMTTLLTVHTFSELILYPWGHTFDAIGVKEGNAADKPVFEKMGKDMAQWNHYTPEASSSLYIASGDTVDWAYGTHGIFAFTFELSPSSMSDGGFYPGAGAINPTFDANLKPMLYMLEFADKPSRVLTDKIPSFLSTPASEGIALADFRDTLR